jgi:Tfp pilus assembly protein PilO
MEQNLNPIPVKPAPTGQVKKSNTKRAHIEQSNHIVFIAVTVAAVVVVIALVVLNFLWKQEVYNRHILAAKNKTATTLQQNISNVKNLEGTLSSLNVSDVDQQKILDALPASYDYPALASEFDNLANYSGVSLQGSIGQDQSASAIAPSSNPSPVPIALTLNVNGSYKSVQDFIKNLELSTRPVVIQSVQLTGTNNNLQAQITANTYYQPTKTLELGKETVK